MCTCIPNTSFSTHSSQLNHDTNYLASNSNLLMSDMESRPLSQHRDTELPISLLQLLSNSLVLYQITPYLPISSLLSLGATSKHFKELIDSTPNVFRYLNITKVKSAQFDIAAIDHGGEVWRNVQLDENVTEDECVYLLTDYILC